MRFISTCLAFLAALAIPAAGQQSVDLLIRNGRVIDGTGAPERRADLGVRGDRIVFLGDAAVARVTAGRTIDAAGLIVAPGFIDPHTHTSEDLSRPTGKANIPYLMQGVTTVVTNNDGGGPTDIASLVAGWRANGIGTNAATYIGHGSVRGRIIGSADAAPTADQMTRMRMMVADGMRAGAIGLSTGLYYAPGSYATTEEVIELARVAGAAGGSYDSHLRDESSYTIGLVGSINEIIRIGREARLPVHVAHIKALGVDVWGQSDTVIALIEAARRSGVAITADQYPYTASGTGVSAALLPRWAEAGGRDSLRARLRDPAVRPRIAAEMAENLRRRGGAATLLMSSTSDTSILGRTLAELSAQRGRSPIDVAIDIILGANSSVASFNMNESDIERFMVRDWVVTGSDGSSGHPRKYGTFPRKIREYALMRGLMTLPQVIHASSGRTATALRFADRGVLREGAFADIIIFDPATIADRATYLHPTELATGMRYVIVNGQVAIDDGKYTNALAGRVITREAAR